MMSDGVWRWGYIMVTVVESRHSEPSSNSGKGKNPSLGLWEEKLWYPTILAEQLADHSGDFCKGDSDIKLCSLLPFTWITLKSG